MKEKTKTVLLRFPAHIHEALVKEAGELTTKLVRRVSLNELVVDILRVRYVRKGGK